MHSFRRFAAFLALPLVFQLALAAKAVACIDRQNAAMRAGGSQGGMPGMNMSGAPNSGERHHSRDSNRGPCRNPVGPGDCQPFAPCGSAVDAPAADVLSARLSPAPHIAPLVMLAPASRTTAPEPPPPRS